jgi:hypothetical protein
LAICARWASERVVWVFIILSSLIDD